MPTRTQARIQARIQIMRNVFSIISIVIFILIVNPLKAQDEYVRPANAQAQAGAAAAQAAPAAQEDESGEKLTTEIIIEKVDAQMTELTLNFMMKLPDNGAKEFSLVSSDGVKLETTVDQVPVNLLIFLDSSSLCSRMGLDVYGKSLVAALKNNLHPQSYLTILSYQGATKRFYYDRRPLEKLEDLPFQCEGEISQSFETALANLLSVEEKSNLPTYAWIFSAGNVRLSEAMIEKMKTLDMSFHVIVYNPFIKEQVIPILELTQKTLGEIKYQYSFVDMINYASKIPAAWFSLNAPLPEKMAGTNQSFTLNSLKDGKPAVMKQSKFFVPKDSAYLLYKRILLTILGILLLLFLIYLIYKIILYYKPCRCAHCGNYYRHRDKFCLICQHGVSAYIVHAADLPNSKNEIVVLDHKQISIGTHRKSLIRITRAKKAKRIPYFTIAPTKLQEDDFGFLLTMNKEDGQIFCEINGHQMFDSRYLKSGDQITISGHKIFFMAGEKEK